MASRDQKAFLKDLKTVYAANTKNMAEQKFLLLGEKCGSKYSIVLKSWKSKWDYLSAYFKYTKPVRRLIYTTILLKDFIVRYENTLNLKGHSLLRMRYLNYFTLLYSR